MVANGFEPHVEPEVLPEWPYRGQTIGFPYSCIHYLRRAQAYFGAGLTLVPAESVPSEDAVLLREYDRGPADSHLINHADHEGFYVPQHFDEVLVAEEEDAVRGTAVGSSFALLRELQQLAGIIGVELTDGQLSDDAARSLEQEQEHPFATERMVWFTLYEAARQSIAQRSVITFG